MELAKKRCRAVIERIEKLPTSPNKLTASCQRTLFKLADSELRFLSHFSSSTLTSLRSMKQGMLLRRWNVSKTHYGRLLGWGFQRVTWKKINGATEKLLATPEAELRQRFKGNYEFVIGQVRSEIQHPIHEELGSVISGKRGIICQSVCSEFMELVSMCGGPNEKLRADQLLRCLMVVPDSPSERMMSLPTTRKLVLKNKIVFGTGDEWHAPTMTANMAFVRAISQTGMSLFTIGHRPRALTGD